MGRVTARLRQMLSRVILFPSTDGNSDGKHGYILSFHCLAQPLRIFSSSMTKGDLVVKVAFVYALCTWLCTCNCNPLSPTAHLHVLTSPHLLWPSACASPSAIRTSSRRPRGRRFALQGVYWRTNSERSRILLSRPREILREVPLPSRSGAAQTDEERKRVIGIMAAILASLHMETADDRTTFSGRHGEVRARTS
jgi:hypothetical protein